MRRVQEEVAELGIACESCHGPAAEHVRVNRGPMRRYRYHMSSDDDPTIVNPEKLSHDKSAEICGQCHGIQQFRNDKAWRHGDGIRYRAGGDLDALRVVIRHPENVTEPAMTTYMADYQKHFPTALDGQFWRDGMVRVSGREYNGLIESGCFQRGELTCLSCHSMHESDPDDQLRRDKIGNAVCLSCHPSYRDNLTQHTFHAPQSSGSQCYNCHMPHTTYGLVKAIRNHEIDSPSVAIDKQSGRPNACNLCHLDRPLSWTQKHLKEWHGTEQVQLTQEEEKIAAGVLWILRGDAGQRALAVWHMGWKPALEVSGRDWLAPFLALSLGDPYATVRLLAKRSLVRLSGFEDFRFDYVAPESQRNAAVQEALARWERLRRARSGPLDRFGTHLLIDRQGTPHHQGIKALLRQRDQRVVELRE